MGICNSKLVEECPICEELYEDIDDRVSELPMMSPILYRQNGYSELKRLRHMSISQIYRNELKNSLNANNCVIHRKLQREIPNENKQSL